MTRRCIAMHCSHSHNKLYGWPKQKKRARLWTRFVQSKRDNWQPSIESTANCGPTLCSQHFSADCFANLVQYQSGYAQRLLLKPDAVPTLHAAAPPNYVMTDSGPASGSCDASCREDFSTSGQSSSSTPISASLRRKKQQRISELLDANDEPGKTDQIDVAGIDFLKPSTAHNGNLILKWQPKVQHCKKKRRHRSEVSMDVSEDDEYRCTSDADKYGTQDNILFDKINVKPAHLKEGPELCVIEEPELCVKEEPELCIDEEPELCVKEEPELCVKEKPELCINEEPELCVKEEPELCVKEEPELCVKEEPELCVKEEPELCVKEEPELCVKEEPELCVKEEPELCINEEPELCVKEEPELCVKEEPELCINEEPELCINEEPELCIKEEPELCVKESEEFPYHVITVKTENSEDKSPVLQRPTDDGEEHSDSFEDTDHSQDYCPEHPPAKRSYAMVPANAFVTDKRPVSCSDCPKGFKTKFNLKEHVTVHSEQRPYSCSDCHKSFKRKHDLKKHMLLHTNEMPHKCSVCEERFQTRRRLKLHMSVHPREKLRSCSNCGKNVITTLHLNTHSYECTNTHMLVHSYEEPYKCSVCEKTFT